MNTLVFDRKGKNLYKIVSHEVLQEEFLIIRKISRLLGKFTSSISVVSFGPLHRRSLERDKILDSNFPEEILTKRWKFHRLGKWTFYGG